ncbi:hypothetical protein LEP1GSC062_4242 [Leptospira alexanderi serovar Manhao 3 str. L 60]|uniref:Uncharacterized protein n=1 Tax=Leptospira alexanderi serovar Manhao 3 str. L 60 TaxID=1049759 RepID=V6IA89_9LEPT|nr:hypothetical protein LEP1GSC062_4242 [Leptospira alexanderi serovar Manhao 3 str. L 60]
MRENSEWSEEGRSTEGKWKKLGKKVRKKTVDFSLTFPTFSSLEIILNLSEVGK